MAVLKRALKFSQATMAAISTMTGWSKCSSSLSISASSTVGGVEVMRSAYSSASCSASLNPSISRHVPALIAAMISSLMPFALLPAACRSCHNGQPTIEPVRKLSRLDSRAGTCLERLNAFDISFAPS